jgi:hypothetical protein
MTVKNTLVGWLLSNIYSHPVFPANIMFLKSCSLLMIPTLSLTIIFLIPNLLSNTKFFNALFSNLTHNLTQLLFSIPPHILYNNTYLSTKIPETNTSNNANQSITKLQTPNISLFLLLPTPLGHLAPQKCWHVNGL